MSPRLALVVLAALARSRDRDVSDQLDAAQERVVRASVYDETPRIESPDRDFVTILIIPEPLSALYRDRPRAVLRVLLKVIDGGGPRDSTLAAAYALSLIDGPSAGVVCVEHFDREAHDRLDPDWGETPRRHWLGKVKARSIAARPKP